MVGERNRLIERETGTEALMATITTTATANAASGTGNPPPDDVVPGAVDFNGRPSVRSKSGCWKSASFIVGVEMAERFAYYGISSNLVTFLTGRLGQSTAAAAANVNAWAGTAELSPLLGAFIADSFLGRYRSIVIASLFYILGLGFLTLSAAVHSFSSSVCTNNAGVHSINCSPPKLQVAFFFFSLYLVAFAQGGHKPCVQTFGADQFDDEDEKECKAKSSFFNWWFFCLVFSVLISLLVLSYIQENWSWELGFGIPCIFMCFALIVFLLGSMTYRFHVKSEERNPFVRMGLVFVKAARNWKVAPGSSHCRFLDKALVEPNGSQGMDKVCSVGDVEDAKAILRLLPICFTCLGYAIVGSQTSTLFVKQGATMDRYITPTFQIPAAALQSFAAISIVVFIPLYDRVLVPVARSITRKPSGISMLQRIGTGMFLCTISISIAALIERKRLRIAKEKGLADLPNAMVPMSVWWMAPQYLVRGVADVFTAVGLPEFLYDQVPSGLKSMGMALPLGIGGCASFLSSVLISAIEKGSSRRGEESWFSSNLNRAHLDYFYWVLASLNAASLVLFVYFSRSYARNGGNGRV